MSLEQPPFGFELPMMSLPGSEPYEEADLVNAIRQTPAFRQTTWDGWWAAARPVWTRWWRMSGDRTAPPDREAWLTAAQALEGYRLERRAHPHGGTGLRLLGPRFAHGEVHIGERLVWSGSLPVDLGRDLEAALTDARARAARREPVPAALHCSVKLPNGTVWDKWFALEPGEEWTLTLLDVRR